MKRAIKSPVMDKQDLKWKAISAAQSTCSAVVSTSCNALSAVENG